MAEESTGGAVETGSFFSRYRAGMIAVAVLCLVCHGNGLWNGFVWDDLYYAESNVAAGEMAGMRTVSDASSAVIAE